MSDDDLGLALDRSVRDAVAGVAPDPVLMLRAVHARQQDRRGHRWRAGGAVVLAAAAAAAVARRATVARNFMANDV